MSEEKHFLGTTNLTDILTKIKTWVLGLIPKKTSELINDALPVKIELKEEDLRMIFTAGFYYGNKDHGNISIPSDISQDSPFTLIVQENIPTEENPSKIIFQKFYCSQGTYERFTTTGISGYGNWVKISMPTKVSELTNDAGYTTNTGTITEIKMNGSSKGTSGSVDLGTVITSHQDISGKVNKSGDTISAPFNDGEPALSIISTNNDYVWQYALGIFNPHITQGNNIYVPIGKGYGSKQCTGLRYHFEGDNSDENFLGFEIYGNGTPFLIKSNKTVHTDNLTSYSPIKISSNGVTGYIGAQNDGWFHITNENSKPFYFNRSVYVDGNSMPYGGNKDVGSNEERWRYMYSAYFNASCGQENYSVNSIIYENGDGWFRKATVDHIRNTLRQVTKISDNRPGTYKIYRRDDDSGYSVQTWWDGSRWVLEGYHSDDSYHAPCRVNYADNSGSASSASNTSHMGNYDGDDRNSRTGTGWYSVGWSKNIPSGYAHEPLAINHYWGIDCNTGGYGMKIDGSQVVTGSVDVSATANTIVKRHSSGYIYATYYNASCGIENTTSASYFIYANSDGWFRKMGANYLRANVICTKESTYTYSVNAYTQVGFWIDVGVSGYYCIGFIIYDTGGAGVSCHYQGTDGYIALYNATGTNYSSITLRARGIYLRN